jgi:very-short-patch-repair endonuclease
MLRIPTHTKTFSRQLRSEMTDAESYLWQRLRARQIHGLKFRRQHPVGNYILDFACIEARLAIEVDGGQHNEMQINDDQRTALLEAQGWKVLRFWNNEVLQNIEGVLMELLDAITIDKSDVTPPILAFPLKGEGTSGYGRRGALGGGDKDYLPPTNDLTAPTKSPGITIILLFSEADMFCSAVM